MANSSTMLIGFIFVIILSCITCLFSMVISSISGFGYNNYDCILGCVEQEPCTAVDTPAGCAPQDCTAPDLPYVGCTATPPT